MFKSWNNETGYEHVRKKYSYNITNLISDYSWIVPDESLDEVVKIYVIKEKCQHLLKLVSFLNHEDLLDKGFESLQNLLTIVNQGIFLANIFLNKIYL